MSAELGQFALVLALVLALAQGVLPLVGAARGNGDWMAFARPAARGQCLFVAMAFACLTHAFVSNDFSVLYVVQHSNSALPLPYRIAGVWGGHEGSILLWALILGGWSVAVSFFSRHLDEPARARILGVMGLISVGFLAFILFTSNPFSRLLPAAPDGQDLNPQLQDPGLIFHPPLLYMGYVGTVVAFAFAISALLAGRLDAAWARWSRPWATVSWCFLTLGIALGSAWAYYELGWGGWWFWDPVENASLMPWLVSTALLHSLAVTEKRGGFRMWTALLAIIAFALSLLGTFLVRSGVLTSVHAFATDPSRGIYILGFLIIVIGGSLILFAWRAPLVGGGSRFDLLSREAMLLANNLLLLVACAAVLLGTLYPLLLDALGLGKLSVGPPYFDSVLVPLMAPALFLMGVGPLARWGGDQVPDLARLLRWALAVSLASALLAPWLMGGWSALVGLGVFFAFWIFATTVLSLIRQWRPMGRDGLWLRVRKQPRSYYGMLLAHCGLAVFIVGVTLVKGYE
ncbi:MAG TPA: heme lyase CcmF/NrfE family subunit, partial [Alicycliphilus sp.]|nr:heme lyase CcmF/NrfE family subunit [Alicycliphilus sp.]